MDSVDISVYQMPEKLKTLPHPPKKKQQQQQKNLAKEVSYGLLDGDLMILIFND